MASGGCAFTVAVTEENVCDPDPQQVGMCKAVKLRRLRWRSFASSPYAAADVLDESLGVFDHRIAATVYERDDVSRADASQKLIVWNSRIMRALTHAQAHHHFASHPSHTLIVRTRFDMLPPTYPVLPPDPESTARLFYHEGRPIVYTADEGWCQPDLLLYTLLPIFVLHGSMEMGAPRMGALCARHAGAPLWMDEWRLCSNHVLRVNRPSNESTLQPVALGRDPRLYCDCPLSFRANATTTHPFKTICRKWALDRPYMRSTRTVHACPPSLDVPPSMLSSSAPGYCLLDAGRGRVTNGVPVTACAAMSCSWDAHMFVESKP
jgi:hypothetical protein